MTMTLVETLAEALGHKRTPNSRCLARVAETPPQLRPPGPHNPPMWCCLPAGHDGPHWRNGGGMYPTIPFRDTDVVVMGDPLPDRCEKCDAIWPCPDVQAIAATVLLAQPAQSLDVVDLHSRIGHGLENPRFWLDALRIAMHMTDSLAKLQALTNAHRELSKFVAAALQEKSNG